MTHTVFVLVDLSFLWLPVAEAETGAGGNEGGEENGTERSLLHGDEGIFHHALLHSSASKQ